MNILIVDDDRTLGRAIARLLGHLGHQCRSVTAVELALQELAREPPDVLLTDFDLGTGCDGIDLAGWTRNGYQIPTVIMTAHDQEEVLEQLAAAGLPDVPLLAKPFRLERLEAVLPANDNSRHGARAAKIALVPAESAPR
jgi:DNA-binding response OmpR family regulator